MALHSCREFHGWSCHGCRWRRLGSVECRPVSAKMKFFQASSENDLQMKWELHLATAADGLYIATHRGVQLGMGFGVLCCAAPGGWPWLDGPSPVDRH